MALLSREQIDKIGFAEVGSNVMISDRASFYGVGRIKIGNNVRIDDYCVVSAGARGVSIGSYIHIAVYSSIIGAGEVRISDFCNISSRVSIYSSSDDYSGATMTNPMVSDGFKNVRHADVKMGKHVIIGCGSVILPGVDLGEGVAIGALSLVNKNCDSFWIYAGNPAVKIKARKRDLLDLEQNFLKSAQA